VVERKRGRRWKGKEEGGGKETRKGVVLTGDKGDDG
jgi:hypothetical protein